MGGLVLFHFGFGAVVFGLLEACYFRAGMSASGYRRRLVFNFFRLFFFWGFLFGCMYEEFFLLRSMDIDCRCGLFLCDSDYVIIT